MERIQDKGFVLKALLHGNTSQVVTIFSKNHGIISGYVKGGAKKMPCMLGNLVEFEWQARVLTHLGKMETACLENFSTVFAGSTKKITAVNALCEILCVAMKENDPHEQLFENILEILRSLKKCSDFEIGNLYIQFEISLFHELGFGFNFKECNVSGVGRPEFISPKTGNVVSAEVAMGFERQLFKIPEFIFNGNLPNNAEFNTMMEINLHFLKLHFGEKSYSVRAFLKDLLAG